MLIVEAATHRVGLVDICISIVVGIDETIKNVLVMGDINPSGLVDIVNCFQPVIYWVLHTDYTFHYSGYT
jgi:hypothetical protein